jgi:hypothetical protein
MWPFGSDLSHLESDSPAKFFQWRYTAKMPDENAIWLKTMGLKQYYEYLLETEAIFRYQNHQRPSWTPLKRI